jgi:hypothetical protein
MGFSSSSASISAREYSESYELVVLMNPDSSLLAAKRSSMSVILSKIKKQTGEAIFPAMLHGRFAR